MDKNKIYFGDCFEIMKGIEDKSIDTIIIDPPYQYLDHKLDARFNEKDLVIEFNRILKEDSLLLFFGRGTSFYRLNTICNGLGFKFLEEVIWDKSSRTSPYNSVGRVHETMAIYRKGNKKLNKVYIDKLEFDTNSGEFQKSFNDVKRILSSFKKIDTYEDFVKFSNEYKRNNQKHLIVGDTGVQKDRGSRLLDCYKKGAVLASIIRVAREHYTAIHPTQKPLALLELLVKLTSNENDLVLDCFLGSGTTAVACINTNRNYIGIEKDKEYFDIATNRINDHVKQLKLVVWWI